MRNSTRKLTAFAVLLVLTALFQVGSALAKDKIYTGYLSNKAVSGYDTVAYFTEGKPVEGSKKFQTEYKGAVWYFKSEKNLKLFTENSEKYAPQYGGYCAYAVARGNTASADPEQWTIYKGKLYLNYSASVQTKWLQDKDDFIKRADKNWPSVIR